MRTYITYTIAQLRDAVRDSISTEQVRQVLISKTGKSTSWKYVDINIKKHGIDTSHFRRPPRPRERPLEDYLENKHRIASHPLKIRLWKAGLKSKECEICGISSWLGKPVCLEMHHMDGKCNNNSLDNLQILCPNCHSQTKTHKGRNQGNGQPRL